MVIEAMDSEEITKYFCFKEPNDYPVVARDYVFSY